MRNVNIICSRPANPSNRVTSPYGIVARRAGATLSATMKTTKEIKKGDSFSCWEVIEPGGTTSQCRCQCGLIKEVSNWHLVRGKTKSCGCKRLEFISKAHIKHGLTHSKEYATWLGIRKRCDPANASIPRYKRYAGRGIKVCDRWLHSFENFLADMGPRPAGM